MTAGQKMIEGFSVVQFDGNRHRRGSNDSVNGVANKISQLQSSTDHLGRLGSNLSMNVSRDDLRYEDGRSRTLGQKKASQIVRNNRLNDMNITDFNCTEVVRMSMN